MTLARNELLLTSLAASLAEALGNACEVKIGWVGNDPFPEGKRVLCLEVEESGSEIANARVEAYSTPPIENEEPVSKVVLDYGDGDARIVGNLYVVSRTNGKQLRSEIVKKVEGLFAPSEPGYTATLLLTLSCPEQTVAEFEYERPDIGDNAEGIRRDEWRAVLRFRATFPLHATIEKPFCRTIEIGASADDLRPINSIVED